MDFLLRVALPCAVSMSLAGLAAIRRLASRPIAGRSDRRASQLGDTKLLSGAYAVGVLQDVGIGLEDFHVLRAAAVFLLGNPPQGIAGHNRVGSFPTLV